MTLFPDSLREAALSLAIARQRYQDVQANPSSDPAVQLIEAQIAFDECVKMRGIFDKELARYTEMARAA